MVSREGTRPFLVEIQALVSECHGANPRRLSVGLESNRLAMLIAILQRHGGIPLYDQDVFVNAVGGVRIAETGADLAILLAILSSYRDRPLDSRTLVFGEVGLSGRGPSGRQRRGTPARSRQARFRKSHHSEGQHAQGRKLQGLATEFR